jgi:predicted regulator of Ras-like GTPase activity (Roadblock/LC7/MglB family)
MSTLEKIKSILNELDESVSTQIQGSLIASSDGFLIADTLRTSDDNPERVAAMVATTVGVGRRMADTLNAGELSETSIAGDDRIVQLYLIGEAGVLAVIAQSGANIALINISARKAAEKARSLLQQVVA